MNLLYSEQAALRSLERLNLTFSGIQPAVFPCFPKKMNIELNHKREFQPLNHCRKQKGTLKKHASFLFSPPCH